MKVPRVIVPGSKIGTATVLSVGRVKLPSLIPGGPKRVVIGPWGQVLAASRDRIVLAFALPSRALSPNGPKGNWRAKGKATAEHRQVAGEVTAEAMERAGISAPWERATIQSRWFWPDLRRRDEDNAQASVKAYRDGVIDAGLLSDDDTRRLSHERPTFDVDRTHPRVEFVISAAAGA